MIEDYYTAVTKRVVTQVSDSKGSFTETVVDTTIYGYFALMTSYEQILSAQKMLYGTAKFFTKETLTELNRLVVSGSVYEIVGVYDFFHKYYDLKKVG